MVAQPVRLSWTVRVPAEMMSELEAHLFPGDGDEHGAVIGASVVATPRGVRLLARRLYLARDGEDYLPGQRGYRMLNASFVRKCVLACEAEGLAYLAVHCHRGEYEVGFSSDDLASHERGYPALLDILDGSPVGALVFARSAVAGDIWLPDRTRVTLDHLEVTGRPIRRLYPGPLPLPSQADERYDRQARLFGDRGQALLAKQKVGVIGAGGAGSLIVEYLAHLGVGHLVVIDPDRIEPSNLPRVTGSRRRDIHPLLTNPMMPRRIRAFGEKHRTPKVVIAERVAKLAQPTITFDGIHSDVTYKEVADRLVDCDYLFLAADTAQTRLLFNALVHQYLIPGVQVGAKVQVEASSGKLLDLFSVVRPIIPGQGCLWCNGLISPARLQEEATSPEQLRRQRYIAEEGVHAPSVITMNAIAVAHATNDYLMTVTGLLSPSDLRWLKFFPQDNQVAIEVPRRDTDCPECSSKGRLGRGTNKSLPVRHSGERS
jgi:molybdopterin/thiamine biosynthesis adenylyltransferase